MINDDNNWQEKFLIADRFLQELTQITEQKLPYCVANILFRASDTCWMASKNESLALNKPAEMWREVYFRFLEVQNTLAAMHYHCDNVRNLEVKVDEIIARYQGHTYMTEPGGKFNVSLTNRFSFEYHAYAYAADKSMRYLSMAIGKICGRLCRHLKSLKEFLEANQSLAGREYLLSVITIYQPMIEKMISIGTQKSVRDWIAHKSFLHAGSLRIIDNRALLQGVANAFKNIDFSQNNIYRLSQLMTDEIRQIEDFICIMITMAEEHILPKWYL